MHMTTSEFIQYLIEKQILKNETTISTQMQSHLTKDIESTIRQHTSFLDPNYSVQIRLHCIMQRICTQPTCSICGVVVHMRTTGRYRNTFPQTCGSKCSSQLMSTRIKRATTNIERYGASNFLASIEGQQRVTESKLERHGNVYFNNSNKNVQTKLEKYGDAHYNNHKKAECTKLEKYGDAHYNNHKKAELTNLKRYNVKNVFQTD